MIKESAKYKKKQKEVEQDRVDVLSAFKEMPDDELISTVSVKADYSDIQGFMVQVADLYKKSGKKLFIKSHKALLKSNHFRKRQDKIKKAYTESLVEYLGEETEVRITMMGKYLMMNLTYFWGDREPTADEIRKDIEETPYCFLKRRLILPKRCIIL